MLISRRCIQTVVLFLAGFDIVRAQTDPGVLITLETRDYVIYWDDIGDPSRFATDSAMTTARRARNFDRGIGVADIVAVNGAPAKGTYNYSTSILAMNVVPTPGQAVVDSLSRGATLIQSFDIQSSDGTQVGTMWAAGFSGAVPPPGAPVAGNQNLAILGGTGAFLGARGQINSTSSSSRSASMTEDPFNRRTFGGGTGRYVFHVIPAERPTVIAVLHGADLAPVTAANPARKGEILVVSATGLGPVRAIIEPGQPFPDAPLAEVNSPLEVSVNGNAAEVLNKVGWPKLVNTYRIDFRVPDSIAPGVATLRLSAAWIPGKEASFPVRD